jgi:hypothetical protein
LEIFKTFDLNPISLNQKFAKPISIFRWQPKSHFGPISMAAQPNSITFFPKSAHLPSGPIRFSPGHSAQLGPLPLLLPLAEAATADLRSLPPHAEPAATSKLSRRCRFLSRTACSVSPSLGARSMLKNRRAIKTHRAAGDHRPSIRSAPSPEL